MASEHTLRDIPCAIASFYADAQSPRIPALAVAVGANVFIYRNLRPYFNFTLPLETVSDMERTVWYAIPLLCLVFCPRTVAHLCVACPSLCKASCETCRQQLYAGSLSTAQARQTLQKLISSNTPVTHCTMELQSMDAISQEADLGMLAKQYKGEPPVQQTVITCMTTIKKAYDEVGRACHVLALVSETASCREAQQAVGFGH